MVLHSATRSKPTYPIESVDRALQLLRLLGENPSLTVSETSEALGVARSTAHRLLAMLQHHDFATQDPVTRAYGPGRALLEIGLATVDHLDVRKLARPELERLVEEIDETVQLITLKGPRTLVVDAVECDRRIRVSGRTGGSLPPHCTSAGKILLSELPFDQVSATLGPDPLEKLTERSIGTLAELEAELDRCRERGYATNLEENELGLISAAVAIPASRGASPAAITVSAPAMRVSEDQIVELAAAAKQAAARIAARIASSHPSDR
jgi:DNA-binding IclR family transcriptional regulator